MSEPYLGEIRIFAGNFPPRGNSLCNGQLIPIAQNTALFSLLGTTYGGNGQTTFALPNLQSQVPLHFGQGPGLSQYSLGEQTGTETVTLLTTEMPQHTHAATGQSAGGGQTSPAGATWATVLSGRGTASIYTNTAPNANMNPAAIGFAGNNQPHSNMSPFLALTFIIATQGIFPARN